MKSVSTALKDTLKYDHAVGIRARLIAEWEHNRFSGSTVSVDPDPGISAVDLDDNEYLALFDLDSIALPNRPVAGVAKARLGTNKVKPTSDIRDNPSEARFYPPSSTDVYKYWSSIATTNAVLSSGSYNFSTLLTVSVVYDSAVQANKIVVGFETSYSKPVRYTIQVSDNGTTWTTIGTDLPIQPDGTVTLWNGGTSWSSTPNYNNAVTIRGVRVRVTSMDAPSTHLDIIQLGARLENDLTTFLMGYTTQLEVTDRSFIAPLGRASANTASVTLSNTDGRFNNNSPTSPYLNLIDKKVKFMVDIGIDSLPHGGAKYEWVRELTMWADAWLGQDTTSVQVDLKDSSVFLQEMAMPNAFLENSTVGAVVWQVLDRVGMTNYQYSRTDTEHGQLIPFYWPETGRTVWEELANLAEATQTAIYFDENDVLRVRSRWSMYSHRDAADWDFRGANADLLLSDIIELETDYELDANQVEISYQPAAFNSLANGSPKMEAAWEPEEDIVVLRATALLKNLTTTGTDLWIRQADASFWPYKSLVNVRGEVMHYDGKEYAYYNAAGTTVLTKVIFTQEEKVALDALSPNFAWKNYFTGKFIVDERGLYGSGTATHVAITTPYTGAISTRGGSAVAFTGGWSQRDGYIKMTNRAGATAATTNLRRHGTAITGQRVYLGTRIRFPRGGKQSGGLWFGGSNIDAGYFLEFTTTEVVDVIEKAATRFEISLSSRLTDGAINHTSIIEASGNPRGTRRNVVPGVWYDLDVIYVKASSGVNETVTVFLDGVQSGKWTVPSGRRPTANLGRFGLIVRDLAEVDYEYLYCTEALAPELPDVSSFLDLRNGGFTSGFIQRDWRYDTRYFNVYFKGRYFPQMISRSNFEFDEFGPVVHEMREFDVKFKDTVLPIDGSYLYLSNTSQVACPAYEGDSFGARFLLVNTSRDNAVVRGEDTITFGPDNSLNQNIFVYGRPVYQEEERTLTKSDDDAIRRRGLVKTEFSSRYIQSESMANDLGNWVLEIWKTGSDQVTVRCFGNPILQLGDLVTINYPPRNMTPETHKYFVVRIENSYSNGYTSNVIMRRVRV